MQLPAPPLATIAAALRRERERVGISIAELARRAGVAKSTLSQLEAGTGNPSIETLWSLGRRAGRPVQPAGRAAHAQRAGDPGRAGAPAELGAGRVHRHAAGRRFHARPPRHLRHRARAGQAARRRGAHPGQRRARRGAAGRLARRSDGRAGRARRRATTSRSPATSRTATRRSSPAPGPCWSWNTTDVPQADVTGTPDTARGPNNDAGVPVERSSGTRRSRCGHGTPLTSP